MIKIVLTIFLNLFLIIKINSQQLYIKTFGNITDKPIIFLHGGPGYNCANFEGTTAKNLSEKGFFVIVYDRRGEGRSIDKNAKFTFEQSFIDLNDIYIKYNLTKASLIGHSFGGIVATLFAEKFSTKINAVFLVAAPVSLQQTFKTILKSSKQIYISKNDTVNLNYINIIEKMDTTSSDYFSYTFAHAMQNRFYSTKNPSTEMKDIYKKFAKDTLIKQTFKMTIEAPLGFLKNEMYTSINLTNNIKKLISQKVKIYGLYGKDDGLYSEQQVMQLQNILGIENLKYFDNCSHNVFIDQQLNFINDIILRLK